MLFNSYEFIFMFLPAAFAVYFLLNKTRLSAVSSAFLTLASLFFYSWWNVRYLPLLLFSIVFNYFMGRLLYARRSKALLAFGIAVNVLLLGYFKYADFAISTVNAAFGSSLPLLSVTLPLAISFYTFQQIAYLVDSYRGETRKYGILDYSLFVSFFPQLIAGPIVYHNDMMPQFRDEAAKRIRLENVAKGLYIFFIGLFKKTVIADSLAVYANRGFDVAQQLSFVQGWITSLSYTFQLYFDFSGYCDMAIGAALLFNIRLPVNFMSPYKATNIQDFWRRWHATLGQFLTKYLYIPLGGSRKGAVRTCANLMIVFLVSGIWHGAGWTFVFWGCLHGAAMVVHRLWKNAGLRLPPALGWLVTFLFVTCSWVFFRAATWQDAWKVLKAMFAFDELRLHVMWPAIWENKLMLFSLLMLLLVCVLAKNSVERMEQPRFGWRTAAFLGAVTAVAVLYLNRVSEFLYFNF